MDFENGSWPIESDQEMNIGKDQNANEPDKSSENDNTGVIDFKGSSDDLLFDPNYIESATGSAIYNAAYLKTTHVTGLGVSCELVSESVTQDKKRLD